jgi:hypothetical protein
MQLRIVREITSELADHRVNQCCELSLDVLFKMSANAVSNELRESLRRGVKIERH